MRSSGSALRKHYQNKIMVQIYLPVIVAVLVAVTALVYAIISTQGNFVQTTHLADVATVIIILPILFMALIPLALLLGMIWLAGKGINALPVLILKFQTIIYKVFTILYKVDHSLTKPVITTRSKAAGINRALTYFRR